MLVRKSAPVSPAGTGRRADLTRQKVPLSVAGKGSVNHYHPTVPEKAPVARRWQSFLAFRAAGAFRASRRDPERVNGIETEKDRR
jgi:hypothetical protein